MKKTLAILLSVLFIMSSVSMFVSAGPIIKDSEGIDCMSFLDFSADTTALWARYNEETGEWEQNEGPDDYGDVMIIDGSNYNQPVDEDGKPIAPAFKIYSAYSSNTSWSLTENGEVLHFEVTGDNPYPGLSFIVDEYHAKNINVGSESASTKLAEYVKIRVRNYSSSTRFTFGWANNSTNSGKFISATISDLFTDANGKNYKSGSGEWETYIFSMRDINSATNYLEQLTSDPEINDGLPQSRWGGNLYELLLFPFGYNVTNGTGAYPGAAIDIDYIVIGSKEYVTNYKSELEKKEESITSLELVSTPTKTSYYVGETLDLEGLQLKATYADGTTEMLDSASTTVNLETASESTPVTLKFGSQSVSYDISVTGIQSIEVVETPDSTVYELASLTDGFTPEGFKFKVTYVDGTSNSEITESMCNYIGDISSVGKKTITANYYGFTTTFDIEIINPVDLEITVNDTAKFRYNDPPTTSDLTINLIYNDGTKKLHGNGGTLTSLDFTITCDTKTPGEVTATVVGTSDEIDLTLTKDITVTIEAPTEMKVTKNPDKTVYGVDEQFDETGMIVSLFYEDGSSVDMDPDDYRVRSNLSAPGEQEVRIISKIEGLDLEATLTVTVDGSIVPTQTTSTTGSTTPAGDGPSTGLIIGIVAAVVVVVAVIVVVIIVTKKKKKA